MNQTLFTASIRLNADRFTRPLKGAQRDVRRFTEEATKAEKATSRWGNQSTRTGSQIARSWGSSMRLSERASSGFNRTLGFLERRVQSLGRVIKYNLLFGGLGLSAIFTGGISAGIRFNATMEQNLLAFKQFLGSTKAAQRELKVLQNIAKTTPFELPDVTDAARKFLAFGFNVNQTNRYLRSLADAAAASGGTPETINRIVLALGQLKAKGRVQGDELLQLTEAGIPAYRILQKELGLTAEQIRNIGKENISAERAIPALIRGMNKLYGGASQRQAKSFLGMWSTLKDNANQALGAMTKDLFDEAKTWLGGISRFTERASARFQGPGSFGQKVSETWKDLTGSLNRWLDGGGLQQIETAATKIGEVFAGAINAIFGVGGGGDGEKSPFYRAGSTAVRSFASGFKDSLKTGDILGSPIARAIEGYLLIRFGMRRLRNRGGGASGGGGSAAGAALDNALGQRVFWQAPMPVYVVGAPAGGGGGPVVAPGPGQRPGKPGGRVPGGVGLPYPGAPASKAGKLSRLLSSPFARGALGAARVAGPYAAFQMAYDAAFRPDHNPFGTAIDIGTFGGKGLRSLFGMENNPTLSRDELDQRHASGVSELRNSTKFRGGPSGNPLARPLLDNNAASRLKNTNQKLSLKAALGWPAGIADPGVRSRTRKSTVAVVDEFERTLKARAASSSLSSAAGTIGQEVANLAGTPGAGIGDGPGYTIGRNAGAATANQMIAGARAGMAAQLANTPFDGALAGPGGASGGMAGGIGGNWGGSQPLAERMAQLSGLPVTSRKRDTKYTASGGISDHWTGSQDAYAVDLATTPPAGDPIAARLGAAIGVPGYEGGYWLNKNVGGYRYQIGWRTPGHFDHIHVGVNRLHGGGTFRARSRGGEGYALLRDGERVLPNSASRGNRGRGGIGSLVVNVSVPAGSPASLDADALAGKIAEAVEQVASNMSYVEVDD